MATKVGLFEIPMRMLIFATLKTPCFVQIFGHICHISRVVANFVLKFPFFRCHGNKGSSQKSFSAPYVEAMFQIWWRSVHKWRHNLVHRRRTPETETGDRTRQTVQCCYALHCTDKNFIGTI